MSGYVQHEREINPNTLYVMAGDMFRGSVIDSEYLGLSTHQNLDPKVEGRIVIVD